MRRRLVRNTVLVSVMVLLVLATPLIILVKQTSEGDLVSTLTDQAKQAADQLRTPLTTTPPTEPSQAELSAARGLAERIEVTTSEGVLFASYGAPLDGAYAGSSPVGAMTVTILGDGQEVRDRLTRNLILLG